MVVGMYPVALKFSEINIVQMAFTVAAFQIFISDWKRLRAQCTR
jgi:hypothetical protein